MPWLIAGFLVMLWIIPFHAVTLPIRLPVDSKLDRFVLIGIGLVWLAAVTGTERGAFRMPRGLPVTLALLFFGVAIASIVMNAEVLALADDLGLGIKKVALLASYLVFFLITATSLRVNEIRAFVLLFVGLASATALMTIWEYRTGANLPRTITAALLPSGFGLQPLVAETAPWERARIVGPTDHGLALTTMLSFALPFAAVGAITAARRLHKVSYLLAIALIFAAQVATLRRTALVMPAAALLVLLVYYPRRVLRLAPIGLLIVVFVQTITPGALSTIRYFLRPDVLSAENSTEGRVDDYSAVAPDVMAHLAFGRGYGTYDGHKYRILDNQYLGLLVEIGIFGLFTYIALVLAVGWTAHRLARSWSGSFEGIPVAIAAAAAAFLVCNALFDTLAFAQVPYLFFFTAALAVTLRPLRPVSRA